MGCFSLLPKPYAQTQARRLERRRLELVNEVVGSLLVEKVVSMLHDAKPRVRSTACGVLRAVAALVDEDVLVAQCVE